MTKTAELSNTHETPQATELPVKTSAMAVTNNIAPVVPQTVEDAFRLGKMVCISGLVPNDLNTPEKATIVILKGMEVGMPPMSALQSIAVINGRPTIWGDGLAGLVRGSGDCEYIKEWIDGEGDDRIAFCETKRKGELEPVKRSFSVDDAKRAGLWGKKGPWSNYPQRMLQMRARAWCLRDVYADILKGMQVREEVEDYTHRGPDRARDITPEKSDFADRLQQAKEKSEGEEFQGIDIDHVQAEMAQAGISPSKVTDDIVDVEVEGEPPADEPAPSTEPESEDSAPEPEPESEPAPAEQSAAIPEDDPRAVAFLDGEEARKADRPLLSIPDKYRDDPALTEAHKNGWHAVDKEMPAA